MKKLLFTLAMTASVFAQASLLSYTAGDQKNGNVVLNKAAAINDDKGAPTAATMDLLSAGLRTKTVLVVEAKIYVAQLFSDNKAAYSRDDKALASLAGASRVALRIDMLRTLTAGTLSASLKEALIANGYTIDGELANLISLIEKNADATTGKAITLLMVKSGGKTNLYYEDTKGVVSSFVGSADLVTKVMSIWLGTPADDGLAKLKTQLLKPVY